MMILSLLLLVAVVFIVIVMGINDSMKKENERLVEKNAALYEGLEVNRVWVAKLACLQPLDALKEIRKQDVYNQKKEAEKHNEF